MSIYRMGLMSSHGSDMEECPCDHTLQGGGRFFRSQTGFFVPLHGRRVHLFVCGICSLRIGFDPSVHHP